LGVEGESTRARISGVSFKSRGFDGSGKKFDAVGGN